MLQNREDRMKTLNETFTDEEYEMMLRVKKKAGLNWHDFIFNRCVGNTWTYRRGGPRNIKDVAA